MKKIDFSFLVPHFSPRNEKLKKPRNKNFSFSVPPIVDTLMSVWNLNHNERVEIVNQPRRGKIVTLSETDSVWGKFSGGKH